MYKKGNIFKYKNYSELFYNRQRSFWAIEGVFSALRGAVAIMSQTTDVDI